MMIQKSHHRWVVEYCNQLELGTTQPVPTEMSSDLSVPIETYLSEGLEDNFRHPDEEANLQPALETMNLEEPLM
jgi:hypothetical protein